MERSGPRARCGRLVGVVLLPVGAALLLAPAAGCVTTPVPATAQTGEDALRALERAEARQAVTPDEVARNAEPPPGVPEFRAPADEGRARVPLAEALERLGAGAPGTAPVDAARTSTEALSRYASGRSALLRGDLAGGLRDLEAAARLAPGDAGIWGTLADALQRAGLGARAIAAAERAGAAGSTDPVVYLALARRELERRNDEGAAALLARATRALEAPGDPALPYLVHAALAPALERTGYLAAARGALLRALELPEPFDQPTSRGPELADLYRQRTELWIAVGDLSLRLGEEAEGLRAYERARSYPSLNPAAATTRVVGALMRTGRSASAALLLLEQARAAPGTLGDDEIVLARYVAGNSEVGPLLARALLALTTGPESRLTPGAGASLLRAAASAVPPAERREILRDRVADAPADLDALEDLLATWPAGDPGAAREAAALIDRVPRFAAAYAQLALRQAGDGARLAGTLGTESLSPFAEAMLLGSAALDRADAGGAGDAARRALDAGAGDPDRLRAGVALAGAAGRWDLVAEVVGALDPPGTDDQRRALAHAFWAAQRADAALETIRPLLDGGAAELDDLLLAADAGLAAGRPGDAESALRRVLAIEPDREDAHIALLNVLARHSDDAGREAIDEAVRDLRSAMPSSRGLRLIHARDLLRSGQFGAAERVLVPLLPDRVFGRPALELLVGAWIGGARAGDAGALERGLGMLDVGRARALPPDAALGARARLLAASGRAEESLGLLGAALAERPTLALARAAGEVGAAAGRPDDGRAMQLRALEQLPPSIEGTVALAAAQVSGGEVASATATLADRLPAGALLMPSQAGELLERGGRLAQEQGAGGLPDPAAREALTRFLDELAVRIRPLPLQLHGTRLALLCLRRGAPPDELVIAAMLASGQHPGEAERLRAAVISALLAGGRASEATDFCARMAPGVAPEDAPDHLRLWIGAAIRSGSAPGAAGAVDWIASAPFGPAALAELLPASPEPDPTEPARTASAAELAYQVGLEMAAAGHDAAAEELYRVALRHDQSHAMANNNLGYGMVERGENLAEAERLLEIALRGAPASASVLDSLGWARYRLGVIDDVPGAAGSPAREGALTLLRRAVERPRGAASPVIVDHLGDALWVAGQHDEALARWEQARRLAEDALRQQRQGSGRASELAELVLSITAKTGAARAGRAPAIAPTPALPAPVPARDGAGAVDAPAGAGED